MLNCLISSKTRFEKHMTRHTGIEWPLVQSRLESKPEKLWSLDMMEETGGEPDVVGLNNNTGEIIFYDCSAESPKGRRSLCYDSDALKARKSFKPKDSAINMAKSMASRCSTKSTIAIYKALALSTRKHRVG